MKKFILITLLLSAFLSPLMADKLIFTEFGVAYSSVIMPRAMENNTTGVYDIPAIEAKAGVNILKWADVYVGTGFQLFMDRQNEQQYYTFYPVYGGIRANIFSEWIVFPSVIFEYGAAFANRHTQYVINPIQMGDRDNTWWSYYYNFGLGINWNLTDISVISLKIERPAYSNLNVSYGELQAFKAGFAFKIFY